MMYPHPDFPETNGPGAAGAADSVTRRHFFGRCAVGLGGIALASMLGGKKLFGAEAGGSASPMAPRQPMFAPRAKNVIYLFMAGGPSQLELFDYKPKLVELNGQPIPQSFIEGKRFAFSTCTTKPGRLSHSLPMP